MTEAEQWREAALRLGEELASTGPNGYYEFTPEEWLQWALDTLQGKVLVEVEPDPALLASMAMRLRHDFGMMDERARESRMREMMQVHEEVVGKGFYHKSVRERYLR